MSLRSRPDSAATVGNARTPNAPSAKTYLCDGGYYDNFGVWSAVNWLEAVLNDQERRKRFKKIVILEIWSAPFDKPGNLPPGESALRPGIGHIECSDREPTGTQPS